ncbi:hypothetical protein OSB04_015284 [Centaurea solstitialis]|uniref:Uncharacterized protein n=1 Tax=Centaurea solstitialis TaxID=347529 RepID=A0AA38WIK9_9ASTR|nr:hypothetical protein OSB04_015284 [Centaurea solstitialis]
MLGSSSCSQHQEELAHLQTDLQPPPPPSPPPTAGHLHHHHQIRHHHHQELEIMSYTPPSIYLRQLLSTCAHSISISDFAAAHRITTILAANSSPFTHLTANQAILEAIDDQQKLQNHSFDIHILDFDIMHGVQWPPLMQAIADRHHPPPTLRITATGTDLHVLRKTGDRLSKFANSLGLRFRFFPLLLPDDDHDQTTTNHTVVDDVINHLSAVLLLPNEILAVNCVLYLHRLLIDRDKLCLLLRKIKSMNPKRSEPQHPIFLSRFEEALSYYTAIFESLEATLPPNSRERMEVEQVWFGREIGDIVMAEGERRRERHERFLSWEMMMRIAGFRNLSLSPFALSQAKLLLRLHYPSEGYNLEVVNDSFFLGWQNRPLFSVSSWH